MAQQSRKEQVLWNIVGSAIWQFVTSSGTAAVVSAVLDTFTSLPTPVVILIALLAFGLVYLGWNELRRRRQTPTTNLAEHESPPLGPLINRVTGQTFSGQDVWVDGVEFHECVFRDCTFRYAGRAYFLFMRCKIEGSVSFYSPEGAVTETMDLLKTIGLLGSPAFAAVWGRGQQKRLAVVVEDDKKDAATKVRLLDTPEGRKRFCDSLVVYHAQGVQLQTGAGSRWQSDQEMVDWLSREGQWVGEILGLMRGFDSSHAEIHDIGVLTPPRYGAFVDFAPPDQPFRNNVGRYQSFVTERLHRLKELMRKYEC